MFPIGSGEEAATQKPTKAVVCSQITNGQPLRIIDSPGLNDHNEADEQRQLKQTVKCIKDSSDHVKLFPLIFNSQMRGE